MKRVLVSWSSGKDSAWTLHRLRQREDVEVVGLLTTVNEAFGRVAMHGTRRALVEAQARAAGLPLWGIPLPWPCSNSEYETRMRDASARARDQDIEAVAFGDLFLEDVRRYRERQLTGTGLEPLFPLWGASTPELAREMIAGGLRARIVCLDPRALPARFAGREFDATLLAELPATVDACGEKGEFHSFVYAGPMFREPVQVRGGEVMARDGFVFADLELVGR
ncbi:MAG: ATP-binding protein [Terriglobales bacterium]